VSRDPFLLFDDARPGAAPGRLYRNPVGEVHADSRSEVRPALQRLREALTAGRHAAGFLKYEAGYALDPALGHLRDGEAPLLWFGLFDGFEAAGRAPDPALAAIGRVTPRIRRQDYLAAAAEVRERLYAGDFYQANLTFGCDVELRGNPMRFMRGFATLRVADGAAWFGTRAAGCCRCRRSNSSPSVTARSRRGR